MILVRNEKIKRVEDYIFYQSERKLFRHPALIKCVNGTHIIADLPIVNYWKKECKSLEGKIEDCEAIHESMDHVLDQHGKCFLLSFKI